MSVEECFACFSGMCFGCTGCECNCDEVQVMPEPWAGCLPTCVFTQTITENATYEGWRHDDGCPNAGTATPPEDDYSHPRVMLPWPEPEFQFLSPVRRSELAGVPGCRERPLHAMVES